MGKWDDSKEGRDYRARFNKENYYSPTVRFPRTDTGKIQAAAAAAGESIADYIRKAVYQRMKESDYQT